MSKELWHHELERVGEELSAEKISREDAIHWWINLGLDRAEAEYEADAIEGKV